MSLPLPTFIELRDALPVIISLIVIEGLLSVDNALAIAAMARHLPEKQQLVALRFGIIGAYGFRGLVMAFASWIISNPWLKIGGAAYLIYLMCEHFTNGEGEDCDGEGDSRGQRGLIATIIAIEAMDLSLSVDNVVAAVAMSPKLWIVCTGVFIGILALRFVATACIKLIEKYPVLEETAFILIGYVGLILVYELICDPLSGLQVLPGPVHISALQKFVGIIAIIAISIVYYKSKFLQTALAPVLKRSQEMMRFFAAALGFVLEIVLLPFRVVVKPFLETLVGILKLLFSSKVEMTKN